MQVRYGYEVIYTVQEENMPLPRGSAPSNINTPLTRFLPNHCLLFPFRQHPSLCPAASGSMSLYQCLSSELKRHCQYRNCQASSCSSPISMGMVDGTTLITRHGATSSIPRACHGPPLDELRIQSEELQGLLGVQHLIFDININRRSDSSSDLPRRYSPRAVPEPACSRRQGLEATGKVLSIWAG